MPLKETQFIFISKYVFSIQFTLSKHFALLFWSSLNNVIFLYMFLKNQISLEQCFGIALFSRPFAPFTSYSQIHFLVFRLSRIPLQKLWQYAIQSVKILKVSGSFCWHDILTIQGKMLKKKALTTAVSTSNDSHQNVPPRLG